MFVCNKGFYTHDIHEDCTFFLHFPNYLVLSRSTMSDQPSEECLYGIPEFAVNPDGWGPCSIPAQFKDLPFELFSRDDKLGMIMDITPVFSPQKQHCCDLLVF